MLSIGTPLKSNELIDTFKRLSDKIGRERVIWRYDPILLNEKYTTEYHVQYFEKLAHQLKDFTEKCTFSFIDDYPRIKNNIAPLNTKPINLTQKIYLAESISTIARENNLLVDTCAEDMDLSKFDIAHAKCIDDKLIERIIGCPIIVEKDKNQRIECGCVASVDIGSYNTCQNGCKYCYANHNMEAVKSNASKYDVLSPLLCSCLEDSDKVSERLLKSLKDNQLNLFNNRGV